jgi:RNase P subunit RPR2
MMPKSTRVVCRSCGAQLGAVLNDRVRVQGPLVEYSPSSGLTIICTTCKTPRPWEIRRGA